MRDAETYEDRAVNCLRAVMEDGGTAEIYAQLDALDANHLHALMEHADTLRIHARREWLRRTARPSDE